MGKYKVFIDGQSGTVGLSLRERLSHNGAIDLIPIDDGLRKDRKEKIRKFQEADLVVLCLPDDAAVESVSIIDDLGNDRPRILDSSTAHRTAPAWTYGFPELTGDQINTIKKSRKVSNPGCYPTGALSLLRPLVDAGIIPVDYPVSIHAVSGYSGGGKAMIADMEAEHAPAFKFYGLNFRHKHLPEIQLFSGLTRKLIMIPSVSNYKQGMIVSIPLHLDTLPGSPSIARILSIYQMRYRDFDRIQVIDSTGETGGSELEPQALNNSDNLEIHVHGRDNHAVLMARLDNLGMGAAGTAIRNMEIMLGQELMPGQKPGRN